MDMILGKLIHLLALHHHKYKVSPQIHLYVIIIILDGGFTKSQQNLSQHLHAKYPINQRIHFY